MSKRASQDKTNQSDEPAGNDNAPSAYEVGYGKPPTEHRFKKGRSGNPNGRPRGSKNRPKVDQGFGMRAAEEYLRLEAYRPVKIRVGEELIELPAIQAVFRAMGVSAMKGNRFAQKTMAELVARLEEQDFQSRLEHFECFFEYKRKWDEEIERCREADLPIPDPLPHPDDIILNPRNGSVEFHGPLTKEQKAFYEKARKRREEAQQEVSYFAEKYRDEKDPTMRDHWLEEWHFEQRMFDIINDSMRGRHKMKLDDRSYHHEASKAGETLKEFVRDRELPKSQRHWDDYVGE